MSQRKPWLLLHKIALAFYLAALTVFVVLVVAWWLEVGFE